MQSDLTSEEDGCKISKLISDNHSIKWLSRHTRHYGKVSSTARDLTYLSLHILSVTWNWLERRSFTSPVSHLVCSWGAGQDSGMPGPTMAELSSRVCQYLTNYSAREMESWLLWHYKVKLTSILRSINISFMQIVISQSLIKNFMNVSILRYQMFML